MVISSPSSPGTRERLLDAAGEVFAEHGFHHATVRDICKRAGANVAAINYHFRDKESLYQEVVREAHTHAVRKYPPGFGLGPEPTPEQRLRAFVRAMFLRIFDEGRPAWQAKIMAREMFEPTAALGRIVEDGIRPQYQALLEILTALLPPAAARDTQALRLAANSVVGQVLHYHHTRAVTTLLFAGKSYGQADIERLADHVARFSLAGIGGLASHTAPQSNDKETRP